LATGAFKTKSRIQITEDQKHKAQKLKDILKIHSEIIPEQPKISALIDIQLYQDLGYIRT